MKIIILGYTGSIGKSILRILAKNTSLNLICVGRTNNKILKKNKRIKYHKWDFRSFDNSTMSFLRQANIVINCTGKNDNNSKNLEYINALFIKKLIEHINIQQYRIRMIHLSSISVYGQNLNFNEKYKIYDEKKKLIPNNVYSKTKIKAEIFVKCKSSRNINNYYSYTILRIANVYGTNKKANLFRFIAISFKLGFWINCSEDIIFNFIHVKDVAQAVDRVISKFTISKNKIYNVTNDFTQKKIYGEYNRLFKKKLIDIKVSYKILKFIYSYIPLPKKLLNLFLLISSKISYSNYKIQMELNFKPKFYHKDFLKIINE